MPDALNVPPLSKGAPTGSVGTADREESSVGGDASGCGAIGDRDDPPASASARGDGRGESGCGTAEGNGRSVDDGGVENGSDSGSGSSNGGTANHGTNVVSVDDGKGDGGVNGNKGVDAWISLVKHAG